METLTTQLHSTAGNSDKIYQLTLSLVAGGYNLLYANGRRTGTLTPGKKPKNAKPVTLAEAQELAAGVEREKRSSGYHDLGKCGLCANEVVSPTVSTSRQDAEQDAFNKTQKVNATCQLLTPLEGVDNCRTLADFLKVTTRLRKDPDYCFERKFDGIRILLYVDAAGEVVAYNRTELARGISQAVINEVKMFKLSGPIMFDGESIGDKFHIFDLLEMRGVDLRGCTLDQRQAQLAALLKQAQGKLKALVATTSAYTEAAKTALLIEMFELQMEGVVGKKRSATYYSGRAGNLYKIKFVAEASFLITEVNPKGKNSVALGIINSAGKIVPAGHTTIRPCFAKDVKVGAIIDVRYLYARRSSNKIVQAVGQRVRTDIPASDCTVAQLKYKEGE